MKDNLSLLEDGRKDVGVSTPKETLSFYQFFVGALQSKVDSDTWANAVATAKDCYRCTRVISSV